MAIQAAERQVLAPRLHPEKPANPRVGPTASYLTHDHKAQGQPAPRPLLVLCDSLSGPHCEC